MVKKMLSDPADLDDFDDLFDPHSPDGLHCVNSKFVKLYNAIGHYTPEQSICSLLHLPLYCGLIHTAAEPCRLRNFAYVSRLVEIFLIIALIVMAAFVVIWAYSEGLSKEDIHLAMGIMV